MNRAMRTKSMYRDENKAKLSEYLHGEILLRKEMNGVYYCYLSEW